MIRDKQPNGMAKHGFFFQHVKHPKIEVTARIIPQRTIAQPYPDYDGISKSPITS